MSEQTAEQSEEINTEQAERTTSSKDLARIRRIGSWHISAAFAALAIWGSANFWAMNSQLIIAHVTALVLAVAAAKIMGSIIHEWDHFTGAKLSGAIAPVLAKPRRFYFMFEFDMQNNTSNQFIAMSLGGILANWLLVVLLLIAIPLNTFAAAMLVAVATATAINVSMFEVPIAMAVRAGADPEETLQTRLREYGLKQYPGYVAGAFTFLLIT